MNAGNLLQQQAITQKCTTGCPIIDTLLAGGFPCNSITELVSESGCGKTQICLQLVLAAQLPTTAGGLSAASLYLHSEFPFPIRRLHQLSQSFTASNSRHFSSQNPCDNILVHPLQTADQLFDILSKIDFVLENPPTKLPVRVIVIDSIAALFRSEYDNTGCDLKRRASLFFKISAKLKTQAQRFGLVVLITNQVVDLIESSDGMNSLRIGNFGFLYSSGRRVCPALGISWANCVNSRLFLSRNEEVASQENGLTDAENGNFGTRQTTRRIQVVFAPHLPDLSFEFEITRGGVFGVADNHNPFY